MPSGSSTKHLPVKKRVTLIPYLLAILRYLIAASSSDIFEKSRSGAL